jgi:hypothetical protein
MKKLVKCCTFGVIFPIVSRQGCTFLACCLAAIHAAAEGYLQISITLLSIPISVNPKNSSSMSGEAAIL